MKKQIITQKDIDAFWDAVRRSTQTSREPLSPIEEAQRVFSNRIIAEAALRGLTMNQMIGLPLTVDPQPRIAPKETEGSEVLRSLPETAFKNTQLDLFQAFLANNDDQRERLSNAIDLWDSVPRYRQPSGNEQGSCRGSVSAEA